MSQTQSEPTRPTPSEGAMSGNGTPKPETTNALRRFLESQTLRREIWKLLTSVTLEVNATVQLKPSGEPHIRAKVKPRKKDDKEDEGA